MPLPMFRKPEYGEPFRRQEQVLATEDLPGVPAGTPGRIKLINGFSWLRFWVFFDNGVELGSIDETQLVRPQHWEQFQTEREERLVREAEAAERAASGVAEAAADTGDAAAAAGIDPNDPLAALIAQVPPRLLALSAAARVRLNAPKKS